MGSWLIWCGAAGLVLGCRWPVQAVISVASMALASGVGCWLQGGVAVSLATVVGGVVALQLGYVLSTLAILLISQSVFPSSVLNRTPSRN